MHPPLLAILCLLGAVTACDQNRPAADAPPPARLAPAAQSHFCGMAGGEHPGPKGQVWLDDRKDPLWFSSVHDTIAFTLLPEEPKNIRVIYVSDMGKARAVNEAPADGWVDARKAVYVIGSALPGGMGVEEEVPFADPDQAKAFAESHGGRVVAFAAIPTEGILGTPVGSSPAAERR
ncbi:MAG: copper resistance protein CopZ [Telmatospirillum sp.]|nr:copper resistance protein CopZ [Telmatospirillum sp.]